MANSNSTQYNIDLTSELDLSLNKNVIKPYRGVIKRNAPYFNNGLSPLYKSKEMSGTIDKDGYRWYMDEYDNDRCALYREGDTSPKLIVGKKSLHREQYAKPLDALKNAWCVDYYGDYCYASADNVIHYDNHSYQIEDGFSIDRIKVYGIWAYILITDGSNYTNSLYVIKKGDETIRHVFVSSYNRKVTNFDIEFVDTYNEQGYGFRKILLLRLENSLTYNGKTSVNYVYGIKENDNITFYSNVNGISYNGTAYSLTMNGYLINKTLATVPNISGYDVVQSVVKTWALSLSDTNDGQYSDNFIRITDLTIENGLFVITTQTPLKTAIDLQIQDNSGIGGYKITNVATSTIGKFADKITFSMYSELDDITVKASIILGNDNSHGNAFYEPAYSSTPLSFYVKTYSKFAITYNSDVPSGVGQVNYNEFSNFTTSWGTLSTSYPGVLVSEWINISDLYQDYFSMHWYSEDYNFFYTVSIKDNEQPKIIGIKDNVVVTNAAFSNANSYDIESSTPEHYAPLFNGNLVDIMSTDRFGDGARAIDTITFEIANAYNAGYQITRSKVVGALFNPIVIKTNVNIITYNSLECYISKGVETPKYIGKNERLKDTTYPVSTNGNIELCPSLFADIVSTPLNDDFLKDGDNYYNMVYWEQQPYLLYWYASGIKELTSTWVIQGQRYAVKNNVIYLCRFVDQILSGFEPLVNIGDSIYIGSNQNMAVFFSKQNRRMSTMSGDRLLTPSGDASSITSITATGYCTSTNTIYMAGPERVIAIYPTETGNMMYEIDLPGITEIKELNDGSMSFSNGTTFTVISLYETDICNELVKINLQTSFYGAGNNVVSNNDCLYLRLYSKEHQECDVTVSTDTITDKGTSNETKTIHISSTMWDDMTDTYYLRYQPSNQKSVGTSFNITSDASIFEMQIGASPITMQISKSSV